MSLGYRTFRYATLTDSGKSQRGAAVGQVVVFREASKTMPEVEQF